MKNANIPKQKTVAAKPHRTAKPRTTPAKEPKANPTAARPKK